MNPRLEEIEKQLRALYAEQELLENEEKAANCAAIIPLLQHCSYSVNNSYLEVQVFCNYRIIKKINALLETISGGHGHYTVSLAAQIELRVDDSTMLLRYKSYLPDLSDKEAIKREDSSKYAFEKVVEFLKANGVTAERFCFKKFEQNIAHAEKLLAEDKEAYNFAVNAIK